jgi:hypothetical protein
VFYPAGGPWLEARSSVRLLVSLAAVVVALIGMRLADRLVSTPSAAGISAESPEARPQPFEPTIPAREPAEGQQAPRPAAVPPSSAEAAKRAAAASPSPTITELPLEPIPRPTKTEPPKVTPPRPSVRPTFDSAVEAYARALTRRDEVALRAVYPSVPREVIEAWSRQDSGVKDSSVQIIHTRAEFESPIRVRLVCTFFFNSVTNAGGPRTIRESRLVTVEKHGENWDIVDSRRP